MLSRFPVTDMRSHVDDPDPDTASRFSVEIAPSSKSICLETKTSGYSAIISRAAATATKQIMIASATGQTERVSAILNRFNLSNTWVIVAGDFNELPSSDSLKPLLQRPGLRNAFEKLPAGEDRWTHRDDATPSKNNQIDYLLISDSL